MGGEGPDGTEVVDTREEPRAPRPASSGRQRGIAGFLSGGRRQRSKEPTPKRSKKGEPETMQVEHEVLDLGAPLWKPEWLHHSIQGEGDHRRSQACAESCSWRPLIWLSLSQGGGQ